MLEILQRKSSFMSALGLLSFAAIISAAGTSHASVLGTVWENVTQTGGPTDGLISNPNVTSNNPNAQFTTNNISYDSNVTGYTLNDFLGSPTFSNVNNGSGTFDPNAFLSSGNTGTYFLFTGQMFLQAGANSFITPHDDGFELSIPGASFDLQDGGPTAAVNTPYTVNAPSAGNYSFTLAYFEGYGAPAVLGVTINNQPINPTPEPATMLLFGTGLAVLAGMRIRRKK